MSCRELITDALTELRVYAAGETPSAEDMSLGLGRLQNVSDMFLGAGSPVLTLDSNVPGPDSEAFMYETAFRLCGPFGAQFTGEQLANRRKARSRLMSKLNVLKDAEIEAGLLYLSLRRFRGDFNTGGS